MTFSDFPLTALRIVRRQGFNLPNEKALLVCELIVFCPVFQELWEEIQKSITVVHEYPFDCRGLFWIRYKDLQEVLAITPSKRRRGTHLENMKPFVLHHLSIILQ